MPDLTGLHDAREGTTDGGSRPDQESVTLNFPRPLYLVVCPVTRDPMLPYSPVLHEAMTADDSIGSFDDELTPILPAVWYALHLPKTRFEVLDVSLVGIRESMREKRRHLIILVAESELQDKALLAAIAREGEPMLILYGEDQHDAALAASEQAGFVLPPISTTKLNQETLAGHWKAMSDHWLPAWPAGADIDPMPPKWAPAIPNDGSQLPLGRLLKSLGQSDSAFADRSEESHDSARDLLKCRAWIDALARMEERGVEQEEALSQIHEDLQESARRLRVPLTLSLPGVAPRYRRLVRQYASSELDCAAGLDSDSDADSIPEDLRPPKSGRVDPPEVFTLMVAHNAAGDDSMAVVAEAVPDEAFVALADLERHWVDGVQPKKEQRLRARLDASMVSFWTESMLGAMRSASKVDAFTNFPIGLLRMPGHTAPLAALIPISYRPLNPLTRAFQFEFLPRRITDLSRGMRVLVAECIPDSDPVGRVSRKLWSWGAARLTDATRSVFVELAVVANRGELMAAVAAHRPDVLVISAHGVYEPDANMAGLMIGTEPSIGDDLGPMPPMVILSSCHSGPRGAGPVSVSDLLLRAGASAVLSTLVPVGVRHNSTFMTRFLTYMSEVIGGAENHTSVLDLWHRVQTNSVIQDILYGNAKLLAWGHSDKDGTPPMVEFMRSRSRGRLRPWRLYEDAEAILVEIAAERGQEAVVREWLRSPGYVPESMMYTFVGDPSCIRLQPPMLMTPQRLGSE